MSWNVRESWAEIKQKILRDPLPPSAVAGGWALGMFVGCSIPFGFQLVVSVPLAILFRLSKIGATVGTLITNPVTIFIIYPVQTWAVDALLFDGSLSISRLRAMTWTWDAVRQLGTEAIISFFLGGLILALVLSPITYWLVLRFVVAHRARRARKSVSGGSNQFHEETK